MDDCEKKQKNLIHKAGWVMVDHETIVENGYIKVSGKMIEDIGCGKVKDAGLVIDHGPGVLMPKLVNAHTHLELCALKNRVPFENGFKEWVKSLITVRDELDDKTLCEKAMTGIEELKASGCGIVCEIATLGLTWEMLAESGLFGIWFKEFLGSRSERLPEWKNKKNNFTSSLAGHAPHTTDPVLLHLLKAATKIHRLPFSIHLAESVDEIEFMTTGKGPWADFLKQRQIDFSQWELPAKSPVTYLNQRKILDSSTIAVHLTFARKEDFGLLKEKGTKVCVCPRSNANLHKKLPDIYGMIAAGLAPCIGTDSLACNDSLSIFDEMAFISGAFPELAPETILKMATINGAYAAGFGNWLGSLNPKKYAEFHYVPIKAANNIEVQEAVVNVQQVNMLQQAGIETQAKKEKAKNGL
ncbi:amidohydrolase family protein [Desulfobacterales bacterium HSG16]|nr:amidohydrolase family protein [Desulfobacterales bacterium HSG16]